MKRVGDLLPVDSLCGNEVHLLPQDDYKQHQLSRRCDCQPERYGNVDGKTTFVHVEGRLNVNASSNQLNAIGFRPVRKFWPLGANA
jgi:hypothetical protein